MLAQRYEKVGQSESESEWSKDEKKEGYSQDEGETDIEQSQVIKYPSYCESWLLRYVVRIRLQYCSVK